ncbi:MAG: integrase [Gammaproteobacteria bacterium]
MEQSLVTLQARTEVCNMEHAHYRGGFLYVIRDKTSADSAMAFIKIAVTDQLLDIQRQSRHSNIATPFLVHRKPLRNRRGWTEGKAHWSYVLPEYLSKAFAEARDASGLYDQLNPDERPTFHEIRGLGGRLYLDLGISKAAIQALMTHTSQRITEIYLERGAAALRDDDYLTVTAPMRLDAIGIASGAA